MKIANDNDIDYNAPTYFMHSPLFQVFPSSKQSKDYLFDSARSKGYILTTSNHTKRDPSPFEMDYLFQVELRPKIIEDVPIATL